MGYRIPTRRSPYYLPKQEFLTVKHFAFQYPLWQAKRQALMLEGVRAITYDGMPHGSNVQDPTESAGLRLAVIDRNIKLVEDTAAEVGGDLYRWLIRGVTDETITYEVLRSKYGMPCGRNLYYRRRQIFYYRLNLKLAFL